MAGSITDTLVLGGIAFQNSDYSPPSSIGAGGKQALKVHKLPGGSRVIDILGPDEHDISWSGFFFTDNAMDQIMALDAMRAAGQVVGLSFCGNSRSVIISEFTWHVRRYPHWVEYSITCTVAQNPQLGALGGTASTLDDLLSQDLAAAAAIGAGG